MSTVPEPRIEVDQLLLDEKQLVKGTSLGRDAWRRLKRNPVAVLSMVVLALVGLLAFFTPLLPLQPPDRDQTALQYAEPNWSPLVDETFTLTPEQIDVFANGPVRIVVDHPAYREDVELSDVQHAELLGDLRSTAN